MVNCKSYLAAAAAAITLAWGTLGAQAQQLQATVKHYSTDDGLTSNAIANIVQDDYGYIWLATWNGLVRFDGYHFFEYPTGAASRVPHLHNRIRDLAVDNQQNIWMRMYDQRIFVLKRTTDKIVNPFDGVSGSDDFRCSQKLVTTSNGDVLAVIDGVGIYKMRMERDGVSTQLITTAGLTVTSMAEGYQNDIWLGTNEGVHRMDASNLTVERKGVFLDEDVRCLYSNGYNIFAGTASGKILVFSYGQGPQTLRQGGSSINAVFVDSHGLIWFSDDLGGANYFDAATGEEHHFEQVVKTPDFDGVGGEFRESNGIVWMRMNHGGYGYYDREQKVVQYFHNDPSNPWNLSNTINAALELSEGVVWESTNRRGLERLEIINNIIERHRLVENATTSVENEVRAMYYDTQRKLLMMANKNGSLFMTYDNGTKRELTQSSNGRPFGRIYGISKDSKGNYWLASKGNGLFKMTPAGDGFSIVNYRHDADDPNSLSDDNIYQTVEDNDGNLWVATYGGGVNVMPKGSSGFISAQNGMKGYPHNAHHKVRTVAVDKNGKVWAGSTDGILLLSYKDGKVKVEKLEESEEYPDKILMSNDIICLATDQTGSMWVGTNGSGLAHTIGQDDNGRWLFEHFGARNGLPSDEIRSITFDKRGSVWFATDHHICTYDTGKKIFSVFSSLEGVNETMCSEAAAITLPNGNVIIGTVDGYYLVDKSKLVTTTGSVLKLRITDCWIDDEIQSPRLNSIFDYYVPEARSVTLPSHGTKISLRFAALNYQLQHRVHYQYKLEGYDAEWKNAGKDRTATYEDLPAGTYKLKIKAFLQESPEKYDQREIEIVVPASFLLSESAIWLYMILAAATAITLMFWRQNRIKKTQKRERADGQNSMDGTDIRLQKACRLLEETNDSIADISIDAGFDDAVTFNHIFKQKMGVTPLQYRDEHRKKEEKTDDYEIIEH